MPQIKGYQVKTAVKGDSNKHLYHRNLTTAGFMQIQPMFYRELIPFEKIDGNYQIWSRTNPLVLPCMGLVDYHYSKYFVRYKDVWKGWDDFYNRTYHTGSGVEGYISKAPYFTMAQLHALLLDRSFIKVISSGVADFTYEYVYNDDTQNIQYQWTDQGIPVMKLLQGLGYRLSWYSADKTEYPLLPIYCFGKIYIDHYFPKAYWRNSLVNAVRRLFSLDVISNTMTANNDIYNGVGAIFSLISSVFYDNDGMYQAWDNPAGPNYDQMPNIIINDNTIDSAVFSDSDSVTAGNTGNNSAVLVPGGDDYISNLTAFGLKALQRLSDMMHRYQIAGSDYVDRFLARFGRKISDTHTAIKLGEEIIPVKIGDVESNADSQVNIGGTTFQSVVGDLSGKGVAARTATIKFKNDAHFGMLIGVFSIVPDAGLYQGHDKMNLHVLPEDFYNPEYDQLGTDAIGTREVMRYPYGPANNNLDKEGVFGFLPRYYEYCLGRNILNGAFTLDRLGADQLKAYHLYRDLTDLLDDSQDPLHHGLPFMKGQDAYQYNRVFYNNDYMEQFVIRFRAEYTSRSSKKSLMEAYEFEDGGNPVVLDANSVTTN